MGNPISTPSIDEIISETTNPTTQLPQCPAPVPVELAHTTTESFIIGIRYGAGEINQGGNAYITTYRPNRTTLEAQPLVEPEAEYKLYKSADTISKAYLVNGKSVPSAVYELLRFGRIIGPDALNPTDVPHWLEIQYPGGQGWVNLNASNIRKFSDADFPHWKHWSFIDDSADQDSRCDSTTIRNWLDTNQNGKIDETEAQAIQTDLNILKKLRHAICKFPIEWNASTIEKRWGWLKTSTTENPTPLSDDDFTLFKDHAEALCFWEEAKAADQNLPDVVWRFHPKTFIALFRQCGWLSGKELAQCIPRRSLSGTIDWGAAIGRANTHVLALNQYFRKFYGANPIRFVHALAQIHIETAMLSTLNEFGTGNNKPYKAFYGRGYMQLTWAGNYKKYGEFKALPNHSGTYSDPRITSTSLHAVDSGGQTMKWFPRFDPGMISQDYHHAGESSSFYWVSKTFRGKSNMNRICDLPFSLTNVGFNSWLVNGGNYGCINRIQFSLYMHNILFDLLKKQVALILIILLFFLQCVLPFLQRKPHIQRQ